jgi:tRNA (guanine-N7-)-methyltransferase
MPETAENRRDHAVLRREVVSFTRRGGRLNDRQQTAWNDVGDAYVLPVPTSGRSTSVDPTYKFDAEAAFGRRAPLIVEIGCGRGEVIAHAAEARPEVNFLGFEVYVPGVAQTLIALRNRDITTVRLAVVDAAEALATMLPAASVEELWVNFPDPWHKKKHNKRRLVTPEFAALAARVLRPGGTWRLSTDWAEYADQMDDVVSGSPDFDGGRSERWSGRPVTRFEAKGIAAGRAIHDLTAVRR